MEKKNVKQVNHSRKNRSRCINVTPGPQYSLFCVPSIEQYHVNITLRLMISSKTLQVIIRCVNVPPYHPQMSSFLKKKKKKKTETKKKQKQKNL